MPRLPYSYAMTYKYYFRAMVLPCMIISKTPLLFDSILQREEYTNKGIGQTLFQMNSASV